MTETDGQQPEENKPEDAKDTLDEPDNDEGLKGKFTIDKEIRAKNMELKLTLTDEQFDKLIDQANGTEVRKWVLDFLGVQGVPKEVINVLSESKFWERVPANIIKANASKKNNGDVDNREFSVWHLKRYSRPLKRCGNDDIIRVLDVMVEMQIIEFSRISTVGMPVFLLPESGEVTIPGSLAEDLTNYFK